MMSPYAQTTAMFAAMYGSSESLVFFFQAEDGIRDLTVTGVQTCALPIFGCRDENVGDVEVHPVRPAHLGRDDAVSLHASEDRAGLRFQVQVLAPVRLREGRTVLRPVVEVPGRRDREAGDVAIPLRVREHTGAVPRLDDARILASPRPLVLPLRVRAGIQHGRASAREAQSIRAVREPEARGR